MFAFYGLQAFRQFFVGDSELRLFRLIEAATETGLCRANDSIGSNVVGNADVGFLARGQVLASTVAIAHVIRAEIAEARASVPAGEMTGLGVFVGAAIEAEQVVIEQARALEIGAAVGAVTGADRSSVVALKAGSSRASWNFVGIERVSVRHEVLFAPLVCLIALAVALVISDVRRWCSEPASRDALGVAESRAG